MIVYYTFMLCLHRKGRWFDLIYYYLSLLYSGAMGTKGKKPVICFLEFMKQNGTLRTNAVNANVRAKLPVKIENFDYSNMPEREEITLTVSDWLDGKNNTNHFIYHDLILFFSFSF